MKTRFLTSVLMSFLAVGAVHGAAPTSPPPPPPTAQPEMAVIVVEGLRRHAGEDEFNRIAEEFEAAFAARHWPVTITFERFAANNEARDIELHLFSQGIFNEFNERVFKTWVTLEVRGTKHDFKIVDFRYQPRPGENVDDMIRKIYRGAAEKVASLIDPYLAPNAAPAPAR